MNTMIPAEMMSGAIQMFIYLVTAVVAFLSFLMTAKA